MKAGDRIAAAAEGLVGAPFRLHGRDHEHGLDCIGFTALALERAGFAPVAPSGYALRNSGLASWLGCAGASGLKPATGEPRRGDVLLLCPGPGQSHLVIALGGGRIAHAHAGIGAAVVQPLPPEWRCLHHWRAGRRTHGKR